MVKVYQNLPEGDRNGSLYSNLKKSYLKYTDYCVKLGNRPVSYSNVARYIKMYGTFVDYSASRYTIWQRSVY